MQTLSMCWARSLVLGAGLALALPAGPASADVWDNDPANEDDSSETDNEIFHGTIQVHDLASQPPGTVDEDWYAVRSRPFSSYEVLVDGLQGEVWAPGGSTLPVDRVNSNGSVLTAGQTPADGMGSAQSVRWANNTAAVSSDFIRVDGVDTDCGTACTTDAQYTLRMWETTGSLPRFNNAGSQLTVLLLQNPTSYTISGTAFFWDTAGGLVGSQPFSLGARQLFAFNTTAVAPGASGSVTVTQDGRFGDLQGKTVALEPATGFSFDTPMAYRPH
jgi:hypothetical protein